jgi:ribosomal protein S18 acetylase RimI-like enzyme
LPDIVNLHSKYEVEAFCRQNPFLHIYALGDLDDFFWPYTTWYALWKQERIQQFVLLYSDCSLPTVLAYAEQPHHSMNELLRGLLRVLPRRFYAHMSEGVADVLADDYVIQPHGDYYKMGLTDLSRLAEMDGAEARPLSIGDTEDLQALYKVSYPDNFFMPRMLETGFYFAIRRGGALVSVAGVHVYSRQYRVAALGNITTRPDFRGQGLATAVTARLCQELRRAGIEHIGLNVHAANRAALACYQQIGFQRIADYGEYTLDLK